MIEYKQATFGRTFGVEIEIGGEQAQEDIRDIVAFAADRHVMCSGWAQTFKASHWHVKYDSTCGVEGKYVDSGWEVTSFTASTQDDLNQICNVAHHLDLFGVKVNDNCGLHVHVSSADYNLKKAGILMAWWMKIESFLCQMLPKSRWFNHYCKFHRLVQDFDEHRKYGPIEFWNIVKPTCLKVHNNDDKKVSLNMVNFTHARATRFGRKRDTVELRLPEGTLDPRDIHGWVHFMLLFMDTCTKKSMPDDLTSVSSINQFLDVLGLLDPEVFYILDEDLFRLKSWILTRFLKHSRVPEIKDSALEYLDFMHEPA